MTKTKQLIQASTARSIYRAKRSYNNTGWGWICFFLFMVFIIGVFITTEEADGEAVYAPQPAYALEKPPEPTPVSNVAPKPARGSTVVPTGKMADLITAIALEEGYKAPGFLVRLAACESSLNPNALGDHGKSRGLFQIHSGYHKTVTDEQAFDPDWATRWTINKLKNGGAGLWTCTKLIT